jgi:hypothetical protein
MRAMRWIVPVAAIEMFVGVMYLAAVVSRLIGLTLIQHGPPGTK